MAFKELNVPPASSVSSIAPQGKSSTQYWKDKLTEAQAMQDYVMVEKAIQMLNQGPQEQQEPPFQMTGKINLGEYNPQEEARQARLEAQAAAERREAELAEARQENKKLQEENFRTTIASMQDKISTDLQQVKLGLAKALQPREEKAFADQIAEIAASIASLKDFTKSFGADPQSQAFVGDANLQLELAKINMAGAQADRQFQLAMKESDRKWELALMELKDKRDERKEELMMKRKTMETWSNAPKIIGATIAQGLNDNPNLLDGLTNHSGGGIASEKSYHIEAAAGDEGTVDCPSCGSQIYISPTSATAVCAQCKTRLSVRRTGAAPAPAAPKRPSEIDGLNPLGVD